MEANNAIIPEYIYKYYPPSVLSKKALLYGELFFSALDELNDPYDTMIDYTLEFNSKRYTDLFNYVLEYIGIPTGFEFNCTLKYIEENVDNLDRLRKYIESSMFLKRDILKKSTKIEDQPNFINYFRQGLKYILMQVFSRLFYSVSFSKSYSNSIMWSHYADVHKGFCLIFWPHDDRLRKNPDRRKSDNDYYAILHPVLYEKKPVTIDGWNQLCRMIYDNYKNDKALDYRDKIMQAGRTKCESWGYEEEIRMFDFDSLPDKFNELGAEKRSSIYRLYYYDQTQLQGVIFGANMSDSDKREIMDIIEKNRKELRSKTYGVLPIFKFYEAEVLSNQYEIKRTLVAALNYQNNHFDPMNIDEEIEKYTYALNLVKSQKKMNDPKYSIFY